MTSVNVPATHASIISRGAPRLLIRPLTKTFVSRVALSGMGGIVVFLAGLFNQRLHFR